MRRLRSRRLVHALFAAAAFLVVAGYHRLENTGRVPRTLSHWDYWFRDVITRAGRPNPPDNRLVFLAIDSASMGLESLDLEDIPPESSEYRALTLMTKPYPWSRKWHAILSERLLMAGARAVVFDVAFPKPHLGDEAGDEAFQEVLQRFPDRIVLAMNLVEQLVGPGQQARSWTVPATSILPGSSPSHPSVGHINFWPDFDGIIRRAQYYVTLEQLQGGVPPNEAGPSTPASLGLRAAAKLGPVSLNRPFQRHLIRYSGPPGTYPPLSLSQVFTDWKANYNDGAVFRDKVVLVGATANILQDAKVTPFGLMPGPEIQLNAANALLHNAFLYELPPWIGNLLIACAVIAAWLLTILVKKIWLRFAAFALLTAGYLFAVKLAYDHADRVVLTIPPLLALAVAGLVSFVYDFTHETLEKLRIRRTLEAYVSRDVVREVLDNPETYLSKLGGQRANVALIVTDLRGFTTMSEEMDSSQLVAQLNEYLSLMVDDIFSRRGSVDKFIGDAILAVWGHIKSEGPAQDVTLAIEAALLMQRSLERLNADWQSRDLRSFQMGCGVNFGEVIFGNIGSSRKMEPTVIGDAVNVTSRLEGLTKEYGRPVLIGEAAAELVRDTFCLQFVDRVTMKGKTKPLRVYSVVSRRDAALDPQVAAYLEAYDRAQARFAAGDLQEALTLFENCLQFSPDDALLRVHIQRCTMLTETPS